MTDRMDTEALRALVNNATPGPWMMVPHWGEDVQFEIEPMHKDGKLSETGHWASIATDICDPFNEEKATAEANATLMAISKALATEVLERRAEVEQLRATIGACRWHWPSDDMSSEMCADHPRELAETIDAQEGEVFSYSRGGVVETRYFAYLRADDQSDSDDEFEVDEATEVAARAKILAEVSRRTAQGDRA